MNRPRYRGVAAAALAVWMTVACVTVTRAPLAAAAEPAAKKASWEAGYAELHWAWAPEATPLRGIILGDTRGLLNGMKIVGETPPDVWRAFCERNAFAWCNGGSVAELKAIGEALGHPELVNAPVVVAGLSAGGHACLESVIGTADRVIAAIVAQPVGPVAKGNDGFNFNRSPGPTDTGSRYTRHVAIDFAPTFAVPVLMQTSPRDTIVGLVHTYGFFEYGRRNKAPWTYLCRRDIGHTTAVKPEIAIAWLEAVLSRRLPSEIDLRRGLPALKPVDAATGWLGNPQTLAISDAAAYEGGPETACWLPNEGVADLWRAASVAMPFAFPAQPLRQPSGLIADVVVHDPKNPKVLPADTMSGGAWKVVADLKEGDGYCTHRTNREFLSTVVGRVPKRVRGCDWIKPDGVAVEFTGDTLVEFTVTQDAVVHVGHESNEEAVEIPAWLAGWTDTGEDVTVGYCGDEHRLRLFTKTFPSGTRVALGPNGAAKQDPKAERWPYITIAKPAAAP